MKDYKLSRAVINIDMVKDINGKKEFPLGDNKIGYIRLVQFGEKTSAELEAALKKLKKQGMQALMLDLRWNPGGLLEQAVDVCEKFLPAGSPGRHHRGPQPQPELRALAPGAGDELQNMPWSCWSTWAAPAPQKSSPVACRTEARDRSRREDLRQGLGAEHYPAGTAAGRRPALRLTTAKYYTPSHKVIHEEGITPDIVVPDRGAGA